MIKQLKILKNHIEVAMSFKRKEALRFVVDQGIEIISNLLKIWVMPQSLSVSHYEKELAAKLGKVTMARRLKGGVYLKRKHLFDALFDTPLMDGHHEQIETLLSLCDEYVATTRRKCRSDKDYQHVEDLIERAVNSYLDDIYTHGKFNAIESAKKMSEVMQKG